MPQQIDVPGHGIVEFPDGMNDDQITAAIQANSPSTAMDMAKSAGVGVGKGLIGIAGLPGDVAELGARGIDRATQFVGGKLGLNVQPRADRPPDFGSADIQKGVEGYTGDFYKPQTTAGKYAETIGEFAPAIAGGPGGIVRRGLSQVVAPAVASEAAGQATQGTQYEPWARLGGAIAGPLGVSAAARAITPAPASEARQRLVEILNNEGVNSLTAGQRTGNKVIQYAESALGDAPGAGQGATRLQQEGQRQFTEAATRRAAAGGLEDAGPEALQTNNQRLGNEFQQLSARNTLQMDQPFAQGIADAMRTYDRVPPSQQRAMVQGYIDDIMTHAQQGNGTMPGAQYQEMRSRLSRQSNSLRNSDPTLADALRGIRNSLDGAMERSISPADRQAWQDARREYGAQKTIEKAASRAGEATAEGQIVPANLRNAVSGENRGAYARGQGPFSELARAGSGVMAPLPNSGTGQRVAINTLATMLGGGLGSIGSLPGVLAGMAGGAAAPAALGRALMSAPAQAYLGNQVLAAPQQRNQLIAALLRGNATLPRSNAPQQIEGGR